MYCFSRTVPHPPSSLTHTHPPPTLLPPTPTLLSPTPTLLPPTPTILSPSSHTFIFTYPSVCMYCSGHLSMYVLFWSPLYICTVFLVTLVCMYCSSHPCMYVLFWSPLDVCTVVVTLVCYFLHPCIISLSIIIYLTEKFLTIRRHD